MSQPGWLKLNLTRSSTSRAPHVVLRGPAGTMLVPPVEVHLQFDVMLVPPVEEHLQFDVRSDQRIPEICSS